MTPLLPDHLALALTLLHFLWQGTLVALLVALTLFLTRNRRPETRYALATLGLGACLALFAGTLWLQYQRSPLRGVMPLAAAPSAPPVAAPTPAPEHRPSAAQVIPDLPPPAPADPFLRWLPLVAQAWCLGALLMALRLGGGYALLAARIRRSEAAPPSLQEPWQRLAVGRVRMPAVRLLEGLRSPLVAGWIRPVLLVPAGMAAMEPWVLEVLLAHEWAHIRRHDPLVNALQCVAEVLLFYHPAVWWISRRIRQERECCCDDAAVRWCQDPLRVAEALTRLNAFARGVPSVALGATGGDLRHRIHRLLPGRPQRLAPLWTPMLPVALLLMAALGGGLLQAGSGVPDPSGFSLVNPTGEPYVWALDPREGPEVRMLAHAGILPWGMGVASRTVDAAPYRGRRIRFSAPVRQTNLTGFGGLWMAVEGPEDSLANHTRFLSGSGSWHPEAVVLDVPPSARSISLGLVLNGRGRIWMGTPSLQPVGPEVPVTETGHLPGGIRWMLAGSRPHECTVAPDPEATFDGHPVLRFESRIARSPDFGTLLAARPAASHLGRRVRLRAWMRGENLQGGTTLWLRFDGEGGRTLAFGTRAPQSPHGHFPWERVEVVLDVPSAARTFHFGAQIHGPGRIWLTDPTLETVDPSVPLTSS